MTKLKSKHGEISDSGLNSPNSRRSFLKKATAASVGLAGMNIISFGADKPADQRKPEAEIPWYRRVTRWGQINLTLDTASNFDIAWWRNFWKKTETQGIILNAGGIYAYYPTKVPNHYRAPLLGENDLFGDLCRAAHQDGLVVFARMDSGSVVQQYYNVRPDWIAIDKDGEPYSSGDRYITCINSPYYNEHIPAILTEIATTYHPEGFTDNSWAGLGINSPCFCENCKRIFREKTGNDIPRTRDWDDPVFREWIAWNYARRSELWDLNTRTTKAAGGPDCTWSGMNSGTVIKSGDFRDLKELCDRADIIMLDHQSRRNDAGFQQNAEAGKYIHGLLGWDKIAPESMAIYSPRLTSKPAAEAQMWMLAGIAGGIAPWWHTVSGYHEDRRRYDTVPPVYIWHKKNEEYLYNRTPVATVGVVWSQGNSDFFGRNDTSQKVDLPWRGIIQALVRARIPYIPVNADHIDREAAQLSTLILPNFGAMTDDQAGSVRRFVDAGRGLFATGESSLYDRFGDIRKDYALGDLFGAHVPGQRRAAQGETGRQGGGGNYHTHLRLTPELGRITDGPKNGTEPPVTGERHPVFKGFEKTDIIPFGGMLESVNTDPGAQVLLTFIPVCPTMPPEDAWMRVKRTDIQGLILNTTSKGSRIAFMPADIDRQFARNNFSDHGDLLANIIRWTSKDDIPLAVEGVGLFDCNLYHQKGRMILHIMNLISAGTWRGQLDEFIPVGPVTVSVKLSDDVKGKNIKMLVSGQKSTPVVKNGWCRFTVNSILNHEVVVLS